MSDIYWPNVLREAALAGTHQETPINNAATFTPELGGSDISWERYTSNWQTDTFTIPFSMEEKEIFWHFRNLSCKSGTMPFNAPFIDGIMREWHWVSDSPPVPVNIRGGTHYFISMTLKRRMHA